MQRSQINLAIGEATKFFKNMGFDLPPYAYWTPDEWKQKGPECYGILKPRLGWDVTDFGSGDFKHTGRVIFTLRNGLLESEDYPKPYCEKVMMLLEGQKSPIHYHRSKMEDIINRGGGIINILFWKVSHDNKLSDEEFSLQVDGIKTKIRAGELIRLQRGQSVCVVPGIYHQYWAEEGSGPVLSGEVSSINDDKIDNYFLEEATRFPDIEEDESRGYLICCDYEPIISRIERYSGDSKERK